MGYVHHFCEELQQLDVGFNSCAVLQTSFGL